jgi:hypothetical protein
MRRTARRQSWTLIGGCPRRQWSSASRSAVSAIGSAGSPGAVSSPDAVVSRSVPSFDVRIASRQAIFDSPSVPIRGNVLPTSIVPRTPPADLTRTDA